MKNRNFIRVVVGQIISLFGNAVLRFALPLYPLRETGSAALFGIVSDTFRTGTVRKPFRAS